MYYYGPQQSQYQLFFSSLSCHKLLLLFFLHMNYVLCTQRPRQITHTNTHTETFLCISCIPLQTIYSAPFLFEVCLLLRCFCWFLSLLLPVFIAARIVWALRLLHSPHTHSHTHIKPRCATLKSERQEKVKRIKL